MRMASASISQLHEGLRLYLLVRTDPEIHDRSFQGVARARPRIWFCSLLQSPDFEHGYPRQLMKTNQPSKGVRLWSQSLACWSVDTIHVPWRTSESRFSIRFPPPIHQRWQFQFQVPATVISWVYLEQFCYPIPDTTLLAKAWCEAELDTVYAAVYWHSPFRSVIILPNKLRFYIVLSIKIFFFSIWLVLPTSYK